MANLPELTDTNFDVEIAAGYTLVDFWAPWCGPCRLVSPIVEQLSQQYAGKIKVFKVNIDENPRISMKFRIMSIPTVMLFKDGQPIEMVIGASPKHVYEGRIAKHLTASS